MSEDVGEDEPLPKKASKRLTPEEWAECKHLFQIGQERVSSLAKRFGVSAQAIHQRLKDEKVVWEEGKADWERKVAEETAKKAAGAIANSAGVAAVVNFESKRRQRIEETKERAFRSASILQSLSMKIAADHSAGTTPASAKLNDLKALRHMTAILKDTFEIQGGLLRLDEDLDPESLPELTIRDLTHEDIEHIHAGYDDDEDDEGDLLVAEPGEDDRVVEGFDD